MTMTKSFKKMQQVKLILDDSYIGFGHSKGLARGLLLFWDRSNVTQEGMGLGTIAIKEEGSTYFSQNYRNVTENATENVTENVTEEERVFKRAYYLDTVLMTGLKGRESTFLTFLRHLGLVFYKKFPITQKFQLSSDRFLRRLFHIERIFTQIKSKAVADVNYDLKEDAVTITFDIDMTQCRKSKICLMNELGADWFEQGILGDRLIDPPSAWLELDTKRPLPSLYSAKMNRGFSISDIKVSGELPYKLFWGREKTEELCWAGFTLEIGVEEPELCQVRCSYTISFSKPDSKSCDLECK